METWILSLSRFSPPDLLTGGRGFWSLATGILLTFSDLDYATSVYDTGLIMVLVIHRLDG